MWLGNGEGSLQLRASFFLAGGPKGRTGKRVPGDTSPRGTLAQGKKKSEKAAERDSTRSQVSGSRLGPGQRWAASLVVHFAVYAPSRNGKMENKSPESRKGVQKTRWTENSTMVAQFRIISGPCKPAVALPQAVPTLERCAILAVRTEACSRNLREAAGEKKAVRKFKTRRGMGWRGGKSRITTSYTSTGTNKYLHIPITMQSF